MEAILLGLVAAIQASTLGYIVRRDILDKKRRTTARARTIPYGL